MPMTGSGLASAMKTALIADGFIFNTGKPNTHFVEDICSVIVAYIQTNAVVNVASVSGVTTGAGVSGPGLGTIA